IPKLGATYWPSLLVDRVRATPVSVFVRVMEAFGTAAPDGSVIVPTMVASCAQAEAAKTRNRVMTRTWRYEAQRFKAALRLPANWDERDFMDEPPINYGEHQGRSFPESVNVNVVKCYVHPLSRTKSIS